MRCIWQMDGDAVKGFKCDFTPIDMLTVCSGLKYIMDDAEQHPKNRERATYIYNTIMLCRYEDEEEKRTEEFIQGMKNLQMVVDHKTEPQTYITEDRTQMLDRWQTYHRNTTSAVTPCSNCQEWDCYGCDYKQTERSE